MEECNINDAYSGACALGTHGCDVDHQSYVVVNPDGRHIKVRGFWSAQEVHEEVKRLFRTVDRLAGKEFPYAYFTDGVQLKDSWTTNAFTGLSFKRGSTR